MQDKFTLQLPVRRLGAATGPVLVVFHGTPGSTAELAWWNDAARVQGVQVWCVERAALSAHLQGAQYFAALAQVVAQAWGAANQPPLHLAGFSLGGFVALQTTLALERRGLSVQGLHLISAAAPLQADNFLPHMAGQAVFRMASQRPVLLRYVTALQAGLAQVFPALLRKMLFASAQGSDLALRSLPAFQKLVQAILRDALGRGREGYLRDLAAYVQPWGHCAGALQSPTWVWHGDQDNWSPAGMGQWLHTHLAHSCGLKVWAGQSHYGCLLKSVEPVCAAVAG